ncbi:MAG: hypothetical protein R2831_11940 [Chitinophagaceae bacterium]
MQQIGKIASLHGIKGELILRVHEVESINLESLDVLMIEMVQDSLIPFFIEHIRATHEQEYICQFEEVASREEAKKLLNKNIYLFSEKSTKQNKTNKFVDFIHYTLYDDKKTEIGKIENIMEYPTHWTIALHYKNKRIELPLHQDLIIAVDQEKQTLVLQIPDGILTL